MRYLANDGRFDVIYSGSLLGVEAYDFRSFPVGTIDIIEMFPLDFEEFCWANGVDESLWDVIADCYSSFFKLYQGDVGLLFPNFPAADVQSIIEKGASFNFGVATENAVAQELRAHGHEQIFHYSSKKVGEVDFLVQQPGSTNIVPIEVKSGSSSHSHAALDNLMDVPNYQFEQGRVLHFSNVEIDGATEYLPIYMAGLL